VRLRRPSVTTTRFGAAYLAVASLCLFGTMSVLNMPVYNGSDAGVFDAIFYQMSLGRKLYRDVFDIKDPLFFHGYAAFRELFGISGPMLWETVLTLLTVAVLFRIAWRVGLSAGPSLLAVLTYCAFYFNPAIYQPLHTYHQALFFLLLALALALEDRPLPAGVAAALALWSKATLVTFLPAVLVAVALPAYRRREGGVVQRLARFVLGGSASSAVVVLVLAALGELRGYGDVLRANFAYTDLISTALNWHNDPVGRLRAVVGVPMLVILGLALGVIAVAGARALVELRRPRGEGDPDQPHDGARSAIGVLAVALGCFAGCGLILRQAAWFNHYFAALAPGAFFTAIGLPLAWRRLPLPGRATVSAWASGVLLAGAAVTGFFPANGISYHAPSCPFSRGDVPDAELARCVRAIPFASPPGRTFAMVGPNSNDSPVASLPPEFVLGCRLFFQFPWHGPRLLDELIGCLDHDVDVVVAENLTHFERPEDQRTAKTIDTIIRGKFDLVGQCGRFTVWERRTLRD
jgi:hypothetical protein